MTVSLGILDNGWTTWLVGPTAVTLTTSWQRFKVTGTMTGGATALWVAIGHYTDGWTSGLSFHAWGACLQQGNDPKRGYARTWGYQTGRRSREWRAGQLVIGQQHGLAVQGARSRFEPRGPHALRSHGGWRVDHRWQHRQRISLRGDRWARRTPPDGRACSKSRTRRARPQATSCSTPIRNTERTNR